ncbi:MAG: DinB family protein [Bacteroidetes bacterium]|nr:MAG: DinB family protein [Bacteroidota bacterium]
MKKILFSLLMMPALYSNAQTGSAPTLRSLLLEQLKTTHNKKDWFVPVNTAIEGLTVDQANWTDGKNHSIGMLANHLLFWNAQELAKFKGEKPAAFNGNNDETFAKVDNSSWQTTIKKLDEVLTEIEKIVETTDEAKLKNWYDEIAHIGTHNAYHTGQIIYIRKLQGSWDANKGVK